jgi:endo-1,3-1,4-beta-glycanase ExoK
MSRKFLPCICFLATTLVAQVASATRSAELYTSASYGYGRVATRMRFAVGDGVVSSFFLWKDGSEVAGTFWNELDFEKLGADCHIETNALYGTPATVHSQQHTLTPDPCAEFHTYVYEWTPESIVWTVDDVELRRETGATATAFEQNAADGMQIRFNVWPGNASFGGNFSPSILPVHQTIDWVEYSSYADGEFTLEWREDFDAERLPAGWLTGSWASPKNLSTHDPRNVNVVEGHVVLSLTADDAAGPPGTLPDGGAGTIGMGPPPSSDDGGCSLATSRSTHPSLLLGALGIAALHSLRRRKRSPIGIR